MPPLGDPLSGDIALSCGGSSFALTVVVSATRVQNAGTRLATVATLSADHSIAASGHTHVRGPSGGCGASRYRAGYTAAGVLGRSANRHTSPRRSRPAGAVRMTSTPNPSRVTRNASSLGSGAETGVVADTANACHTRR